MRSKWKKIFVFIQDFTFNALGKTPHRTLTFIVEADEWAIKECGRAITKALNKQQLIRSRISTTATGLRNQIVHFGSVNTFFRRGRWRHLHPSNRVVLTWFHVEPGDERLRLISMAQRSLHYIHTSCETTKHELLRAGVDEHKIVVIPLGVDLELFTLQSQESRHALRERLGIPQDRFVIGSFQKDGVGWGEGMEPKLIKGPDVFVEVVDQLRDHHPFVLLTGPARGYMKAQLKKRKIDYVHVYPKNFRELPKMYHALDLYLITSRVEGGPLSLLESWASGVPVVSTRVGMVPDITHNEHTALLADVGDVDALAQQMLRLMNDKTLREKLTTQALKDVRGYSWNNIALRYFDELYCSLL